MDSSDAKSNQKIEQNLEEKEECSSSSAGDGTSNVFNEGITPNKPPCLIVLGMAGSGKTSFVQRLSAHLHAKGEFPYLLNLDPATSVVPFPANIDIRDTVNYKSVMKEFGLGPNGAILTCLNLFCTRFNQVIDLLEKRQDRAPLIVADTPGQIEAFTWSASGAIITDSLASRFPTVVAYVVDLARSANPTTFMSNMIYACSILYRTKLPFFLVLNKSDVTKPDLAMRWMTDFEAFQEAIDDNESSYMNDLTRSMSLVLDSFYENLNCVAVSSRTGAGFDQLMELIAKCKQEYFSSYQPMVEELARNRRQMQQRLDKETEKTKTFEKEGHEGLAKLSISERNQTDEKNDA